MNDYLPQVVLDKHIDKIELLELLDKQQNKHDVSKISVKDIESTSFFADSSFRMNDSIRVFSIDAIVVLNSGKKINSRFVSFLYPIKYIYLYKKNQIVGINTNLARFNTLVSLDQKYITAADHLVKTLAKNEWYLLQDIPLLIKPNTAVKVQARSPISSQYVIEMLVPVTVISDMDPKLLWPNLKTYAKELDVICVASVKEQNNIGKDIQSIEGLGSILIRPITKVVTKVVERFGRKQGQKLAQKGTQKTAQKTTQKTAQKATEETTEKSTKGGIGSGAKQFATDLATSTTEAVVTTGATTAVIGGVEAAVVKLSDTKDDEVVEEEEDDNEPDLVIL